MYELNDLTHSKTVVTQLARLW